MQAMKMVQSCIPFKFLTPNKISLGHSNKDTVEWEIFIKNVPPFLQIKKMTYQNFHTKNYSVIPMKISYKKEKNNYKIIIIHF
jgi:hypothetical protein